MKCSRRFGRLLQASCLGLIGTLTVVGCGGSDTPAAKKDAGPDGAGATPLVGVVTVTPSFLDFASVDVGAASTAQIVTVKVTGAAAPINATVTGAGFSIAATTCAATQAIGTCTVSVKFAPTAVGGANGALTVGGASVALSGTGTAVGQFSATDRVELGTLLVNATASAVVQIVPNTAGGVTGLTCLASGADLTLASQTCLATGAITAPCTFTYAFKAATPGNKTAAVVCSGGGKTTTTTVAATVVTPSALAIGPSPQIFTAIVGQPVTFAFNVSNSGGSPTGTLAASISAGGPDFAIASNDCVVALPPLGVCKISVTFTPTAAGAKAGTLTVTDATPGSLPAVAVLTGTGIADKLVVITPATSDFGSVQIPAVKTTAFTMTNNGGTATDIVALAASDAAFTVGSDLCSGRPLAAKGQCTFAVTFTPAGVAGLKQAMVNATQPADGAILASAAVTGTVVAAPTPPKLVFSPPTLDFGTTGVGVSVGPKVFTLTNEGGTPTGTLSVVKNDSTSSVGGASQFTYTTTCTGALAPAASCELVVTFSPTITRAASAVINVSDNNIASAFGTVTGIALAIPNITVDCGGTSTSSAGLTAKKFDDTVTGLTSAPVVCVIENTNRPGASSDTPQESGAITPTLTGPFAIATNNCPASLAPGLSCTISVVFKPTARGEIPGMLTVSTANRGADNLDLFGTGLLVVELRERVAKSIVAITNPLGVVTDYDFGQVSLGDTSKTVMTIDVFVRGPVGNLALSGTNVKWPSDTALADFTTSGCEKIYSGNAFELGVPPRDPKTTPLCSMVVAFNPQGKNAKANIITARGGDGTSDTASMKGTGTGPITIEPSPLTFDAVAVGASSTTPLTLTVCNNAPTPGSKATFTITGPNAADFAVVTDTVSNQNLDASASPCKYQLLRLDIPADGAVGPRTATVTVTAIIAGVTESATSELVGSVVTGAALKAELSGPFADTAMTNISAPVVLTVTNTGSLRTDELNFEIPTETRDAATSDFFFKPDSHADLGLVQGTCVNGITRLEPGASCTLNIWFIPNQTLGVVQRNGIITVSSAVGGLKIIGLTGKATSQITISPTTVDLGAAVLGDNASPTVTLTITNHGGKAIAQGDLDYKFVNGISQTGADSFTTVQQCSSTAGLGKAGSVTPPDNCTVQLQMRPAGGGAPGVRTATYEVTNTASNTQKAVVQVSGTAVAKPDLQFTAASFIGQLKNSVNNWDVPSTATGHDGTNGYVGASQVDRDFGSVALNTTSKAINVTLTNIGGAQASALSYDFYECANAACTSLVADSAATGAYKFKVWAKKSDIVRSGCDGDRSRLAGGASCDISVAFHPTTCLDSDPECDDTGSIAARLVAVYTLAGQQQVVEGPVFRGLGINTVDTLPSIVEAVSGLAPYDFGLVVPATTPSVKVTLSVRNATQTAFTIPSTATFITVAGQDVVNPAEDKWEMSAGTCVLGTQVLAGSGAGQSCTVVVTWTPTTDVGTREMQMQFGTAAINLIGRVPQPARLVAVSPHSTSAQPLDFGNAVTSRASAPLTLVLQNQGEVATDGELKLVGTGTQAVAATGCTAQLGAGKTCEMAVTVTPAATGQQNSVSAFKIVLSNDTTEASILSHDIYAKWYGVKAAAISRIPANTVNFDPSSTSTFGTELLSDGTSMTITLTNAANSFKTGPMTFRTDKDDYSIDLDVTKSTCLAGGYAFDGLAPDASNAASCNIVVVFSPTSLAAPVIKTGNLIVTSANAATVTIPLSGTAIAALTATASGGTFTAATATATAKVEYPATSVANSTNYPQSVITITKATGTPATGLLSTGLSGANANQYRIVDDKCIGVSLKAPTAGQPNAHTCTVTVRFSPNATGAARAAVLTVLDPVSGTPADSVSVALVGDANP